MDSIASRRVLAVALIVVGAAVAYLGISVGQADDAPGAGVGGLLIMACLVLFGARMFWRSLDRSKR